MQTGVGSPKALRKPQGLKRRRDRAREAAAEPVKTNATDLVLQPDPIDALTVIKGVVDRVPEALAAAGADEAPQSGALATAVRRAVLDEFRTRAQFAGRLAEIDALLWSRADDVRELVEGPMTAHLRELRLRRVTEPEASDRFVVTEGEGDAFELLSPAYVDELTGKVILAGRLRRVAGPAGMERGEEV
jgi:hypothetical protein